MRTLLLSLFCGALTGTALAQTELDVAERIRLRELLRVAGTTSFSLEPKISGLPVRDPLNVYLGFGLNYEIQRNFVRWIEEWNCKQGARGGYLLISDNVAQADVILACYPASETALEVSTTHPGKIAGVYDKTATRQELHTTMQGHILLPVDSTPLHLRVIWRGKTESKLKARPAPGAESCGNLQDTFASLLKRKAQPR